MRPRLHPAAAFAGALVAFWGLGSLVRLTIAGRLSPIGENVIFKALLTGLCLLAMVADRRSFADFGFRRPGPLRWRRVVLSGLGLGAAATFTLLASPAKGLKLMEGAGLLQVVLGIWIWSTLTEEIFTRGLVQTWIRDDGRRLRGGRWSVPVVTSALLFGALHLMLWSGGTDAWTVAIVCMAATFLGLAAGTYRERSGSLWPAIITHGAFNVGGFLGGVLWFITTRILTRGA